MTAKEFVKQYYPHARATRYTSGRIKGMTSAYYLVHSSALNGSRLSEGNTESKAWTNAKKFIVEYDIQKPETT